MNSKLLYAATLALALASTFAVAGDNPLTRQQVLNGLHAAQADDALRRNDYDYDRNDFRGLSTRTRAEVVADMTGARRDPRLIGPLRNRTYNAYGTEMLGTTTLAREDVKLAVRSAIRDGSLRRTDYDDLPTQRARRATTPAAPLLATATPRP